MVVFINYEPHHALHSENKVAQLHCQVVHVHLHPRGVQVCQLQPWLHNRWTAVTLPYKRMQLRNVTSDFAVVLEVSVHRGWRITVITLAMRVSTIQINIAKYISPSLVIVAAPQTHLKASCSARSVQLWNMMMLNWLYLLSSSLWVCMSTMSFTKLSAPWLN